ncbi:MAG TPA: hypothetical protein VG713_06330 [Pirellulales bacterium]|nr:hypothetical protein [Pirellulales bacterium]
MKPTALLGMLVLSTFAAGCAEFQQGSTSFRAHCVACRAYLHRARTSCEPKGHAMKKHYGKGWRQGYVDVASGRSGTPCMPPETYWGPAFRNAKGHAEIQAWFNGYEQGTIAAEQAGEGQWMSIPTFAGALPGPKLGRAPMPMAPPGEEVPTPDVLSKGGRSSRR